MNENSRCSILFHLLVPGGKWQTEISSPISSASFCSSHFHSLTRAPLLPPESAVIKTSVPCGQLREPLPRPPPGIVSPPNAPPAGTSHPPTHPPHGPR